MREELIAELSACGVRYNEDDIVFITRDMTGQIVWLEDGNEKAGLKHIIERHLRDFSNTMDITEKELPKFLENVVSKGAVVSNIVSQGGYSRVYDYDNNYYTIAGIGKNGFIVTAYPTPKEE